MLMPLLSVSAIGFLVGVVGGMVSKDVGRGLLRGLIAAWLGFAAGGMLGVIVDTVTGSGSWLAWLGHLGAVAAAIFASLPRSNPSSQG